MLGPVRRWVAREAEEFPRALESSLRDCESVLDVGCGTASPVRLLSHRPGRLVGVDGYAPSIEESRRAGIHDEYHCAPLAEIGRHFQPRSFDAVVLLDVIEHFEKPEAMELLAEVERIASRRVVLFTPNGFLPQGERYGNPYQVHRSGWTPSEMRARGYRVLGLNGWRPLRGDLAQIRLRPRRLWWAASILSQPIVRSRPEHAFQLLCVRESAAP